MNGVNDTASTIILPTSTDDVAGTIVLPQVRRRFGGANRGLVIAMVVILTLVILAATGVGIFFVVRAVQKRKRARREKAAAAAAAAAANTSTAAAPQFGGVDVGENVTSTAPAKKKVCDHKKSQPGWEYTVRDLKGGTWECPQGYEENGCDWADGKVAGRLQCRRAKGRTPAPAPKKCDHKTPQEGYEYTTRVDGGGGTWKCPNEYEENGCDWGDGDVAGPLQCRRKTKKTKPPRTTKPPKPPATIKCDHRQQKMGWEYTTRVDDGKGGWKCPNKFDDNGCSWGDGEGTEWLQCRRKVKDPGGGGGGGGGGGSVLPMPILARGKAPWYIRTIRNKKLIRVVDDTIEYSFLKGTHGSDSGPSIYANPNKVFPAESVTMSFEAYFPSHFDFVKAGKLLGLSIADKPGNHASGGKWAPNGASARFMWRDPEGDSAQLKGYVYMAVKGGPEPAYAAQGPRAKAVMDPEERTGLNLWFKKNPGMRVTKNTWNTVSMTVVLNTPGKQDGFLRMTCNGVTREVDDLVWRESSSVKIQELFLTAIFGGSGPEFASKVDTHCNFRKFKLEVPGAR